MPQKKKRRKSEVEPLPPPPETEIKDDDKYNEYKTLYGIKTPTFGVVQLIDDPKTKNKKTLGEAKRKAEDAMEFIEKYSDKTNFGKKQKTYTARTVPKELKTTVGVIETAIKDLERIEIYQQNIASQTVTKLDGKEYRGDGTCYVRFVSIGLGDCTLITTPLGKKIMIDCGSDSLTDVIIGDLPPGQTDRNEPARKSVNGAITSNTFLQGTTAIDILLLTHPDADHWNELEDQLRRANVNAVGLVYYGGAEVFTEYKLARLTGTKSQDGKGGTKGIAGVIHYAVLRHESDPGKKIVLTQTIDGKKITATSGAPGTPDQPVDDSPFVDPKTKATVLYYEPDDTSDVPKFRLSLVAANVTGAWKGSGSSLEWVAQDSKFKGNGEAKLDGSKRNRGSLMILVEAGDEAILVCGDATAVTENFVVRQFPDLLKKVTHLRMGHHGSPTSSSASFIKAMTKLRMAVASTAGERTVLHALPKIKVLDQYLGLQADADEHSIWSFDKDSTKVATVEPRYLKIKTQLFATGSNKTRELPPFALAPKIELKVG